MGPFCYFSHKEPELRLHLTSSERHHQHHQVAAYWKHRPLSPTCSPLDPSPHFSKISGWLTPWSLKSTASLYSASKTSAYIRTISSLLKTGSLGLSPTFWFSASGIRPYNLHFKQVVRWPCCCWPGIHHSLRTNGKVYNRYNFKDVTFMIINGFSFGDQRVSKYRKVMQLGTTFSHSFLVTCF